MSNSDVVTEMLGSWSTKNVDKIVSFFTDDAIYTNVPIHPPNKGVSEIRDFLEWFVDAIRNLDFIIHRQVEGADGTVMNERTDRLDFTGSMIDLPVMGVFEFRNGRICAWRDYFDMALLSGLGTPISVPRSAHRSPSQSRAEAQ